MGRSTLGSLLCLLHHVRRWSWREREREREIEKGRGGVDKEPMMNLEIPYAMDTNAKADRKSTRLNSSH